MSVEETTLDELYAVLSDIEEVRDDLARERRGITEAIAGLDQRSAEVRQRIRALEEGGGEP